MKTIFLLGTASIRSSLVASQTVMSIQTQATTGITSYHSLTQQNIEPLT